MKKAYKNIFVIGLTGSIGMGKSTAANMMSRLGAPVHSADKAVHKALAKNGAAVGRVVKIFPEVVSGASVNRKKLGREVFSSDKKLKKLERILHPIVRQSEIGFIKKAVNHGKKAVVLEIPLLFETKAEKRCDFIVCVTAPTKIQRARVLKRKGMTSAVFKAILKKQMPDREKCKRADCVIQTGASIAETNRQIKAMWKKLIEQGKIKQCVK